jgi:hypothetical protein
MRQLRDPDWTISLLLEGSWLPGLVKSSTCVSPTHSPLAKKLGSTGVHGKEMFPHILIELLGFR